MPRADWKFLLKSEFKRPSKDMLKLFNNAMKPICAQLKNLALHNQQLTKARDLLLPRLMDGEYSLQMKPGRRHDPKRKVMLHEKAS